MNELFDGEQLRGLVDNVHSCTYKTEETPLAHTEVSLICLCDSQTVSSVNRWRASAATSGSVGVEGCVSTRQERCGAFHSGVLSYLKNGSSAVLTVPNYRMSAPIAVLKNMYRRILNVSCVYFISGFY
jgi:hypothetical protein